MKKLLTLIFAFAVTAVNGQYSWNNLPTAKLPVFKKDTVDIRKFGARGDGLHLNTNSINEAIQVCSKNGGGVVLIPAGLWTTGPITLQSNVNLHLASAAILQFTTDFDQYPLIEGNYEGQRSARNQSPISATSAENIAITGSGVIDGNGDAWRSVWKDRLTVDEWKKKVASGGLLSPDGKLWYPSAKSKKATEEKLNGFLTPGKTLKDFESIKDFLRPNLVVLTRCKKVLLEGVTFQNSPAWNLHPLMCEDLTLRNLSVRNPKYADNGDGVDVESCRNVLIDGCVFDVGDDGICIKSGRDEEGRKRAMPTENMVVRNSTVYKAHGGFVIGSEMSGGARNIFVYDCSFIGSDRGLRFKTTRGRGGVVEKIYCRNIYMKDIQQDAIYFDMYYFTPPPKAGESPVIPSVTEATPQFRDFFISDIICDGAERGIFIRGLPEMALKNISIKNVVLHAEKASEIIEASGITLEGVTLVNDKNELVMRLENSSDIRINKLKYTPAASVIFEVSGDRSKGIRVSGTDMSSGKAVSGFINGAEKSALKID